MSAKVKRRSFRPSDILEKSELEEKIRATPPEVSPDPWPWLTLETLLYGLILTLALALRLWNLGAYPLSNAEAEQSLLAFRLYQGNGLEASSYSPLLVSLNTLTFVLFGSSDFTARLASALLGSLVVCLPLTLRRQLGAPTCLLATLLLAISPAALFLSRTLNSEIGVTVGALLMAAGFFNWAEDGRPRWLWLLAGGLAILLTAGPMAYSILIVFGLMVLLRFTAFKALWIKGLSQIGLDEIRPQISDEGDLSPIILQHGAARDGANTPDPPGSQTPRLSPETHSSKPTPRDLNLESQSMLLLRNVAVFFGVTLILLATAATFNLSGLGVLTSLPLDWFSRFSWQAPGSAGFNAVFLLTIYEPLLVFAGLAGLAYAILKNDLLKLTLVGWFVGALLLDIVMAGRPNGNVILSLVPLAFLAALALSELWAGIQARGDWTNEGIIVMAGLVIVIFGYIGLTRWLISPTCVFPEWFCSYPYLEPILVMGIPISLFLVIIIFFWFLSNAGAALRGAGLTGAIVGLLLTISLGWRLNYGPLMYLAYQPLAGIPASTELTALTETLAGQSIERVGDETLLETILVGISSPALRWQLRNYEHLTQVSSLAEAPVASAIITLAPAAGADLGFGQAYLGQSFALDAIWSPVGLPPKTLVNWLLYRRAEVPPQGNQAVLWLRLPENEGL